MRDPFLTGARREQFGRMSPVIIQKRSAPQADTFGVVNPGSHTMEEVRQTWARVQPRAGSETIKSAEEISIDWAVITMRWQNAKDVTADMFILDRETKNLWDIRSISDIDSTHEFIQFTCRLVK